MPFINIKTNRPVSSEKEIAIKRTEWYNKPVNKTKTHAQTTKKVCAVCLFCLQLSFDRCRRRRLHRITKGHST